MTSTETPNQEMPASEVVLRWAADVMSRIRRTGRRGIALACVGAAAGVALALALPSQYTASASFIAQGSTASLLPSALQGIAASVGLANAKDYSPQFYADLVTSQPVLTAALERTYDVPASGHNVSRTYIEFEHIRGRDSAARVENAIRRFRRQVTSRADVRTNIISVSVTARYPTVSRDLTRALLDALDSMNISFRREQSRELREFFETRVTDAQRELDAAEGALREFLERNRATQSSPILQFEQARLTRVADLKRTVYTTVVQQYEEAKIQEARNVPVLTILAAPTAPTRKSGPPRRLIVVAATLIGLLAAIGNERLAEARRLFTGGRLT